MKFIAISESKRVNNALLFNSDIVYTIDDTGDIKCIKNRFGDYRSGSDAKEDLYSRICLNGKEVIGRVLKT